MTKSSKAAVLFLFAVVSLALLPISATYAIRGGQPDGDLHPYVGLVNVPGVGQCSGVAVSPTKLLTAAHCLRASGQPVQVTFAPNAWTAHTWYEGIGYPDPQFCLDCQPGLHNTVTHDVAVVIFSSPIGLSTYATLPSVGQADTLPNKTLLTIVGYGLQVRPKDFEELNQVFQRYYAPTSLIPSNDVGHEEFLKLSANESKDKGGTCFGDSGGPALLGNTVLGLTSYGTNDNCAGVSYSYRIDTEAALSYITAVNQ